MCRKKLKLKNRKIVYQHDFTDGTIPPEFHIKNNEPHGKPVQTAFFKENVKAIKGVGLVIVCKYQPGIVHAWNGDYKYEYSSGCVQTWDKDPKTPDFLHTGGIWDFEAIIPNSWAAIWMLHPDYSVPEYYKKFIIPEIDVAENNGHGIDNCVHYGYSETMYRTSSKINRMHCQDGKFHEYSVDVLIDGYDFYLDGKRRTKFRGKGDFVAEQPFYMIINNASDDRFYLSYTELIIKNVRVYK